MANPPIPRDAEAPEPRQVPPHTPGWYVPEKRKDPISEAIDNLPPRATPSDTEVPKAQCRTCGLDYDDFGMDLVLPNHDWNALVPEGAETAALIREARELLRLIMGGNSYMEQCSACAEYQNVIDEAVNVRAHGIALANRLDSLAAAIESGVSAGREGDELFSDSRVIEPIEAQDMLWNQNKWARDIINERIASDNPDRHRRLRVEVRVFVELPAPDKREGE